jgi:hypothetical protein
MTQPAGPRDESAQRRLLWGLGLTALALVMGGMSTVRTIDMLRSSQNSDTLQRPLVFSGGET